MRAAALLLLLPSTALAADLAVHEAPPRPPKSLQLRAQATPPARSVSSTSESGGERLDPDAGEDDSRWRDAEERLVFKVQLGYALDDAPPSGEPRRGGRELGDRVGDAAVGGQPLRTRNDYLLGDAVLGSRGVPVASLSTYFASQFRLGLAGPTQNATQHDVWDGQSEADLLFQVGWAEYEAKGIRLRAGRQFHHGAALFAAQFDGATLAYERPDYEVSGFVGRRAAIYLDETPGVLAGVGARVRLQRIVGWPVALAADVMSHEGAQLYLESSARLAVGAGSVSLSARGLDNDDGDGMGLGRIAARARYPLSARFHASADATYLLSHEVAYDYLSPEAADVTTGGIALALPAPEDTLRLGGALSALVAPGLEAYTFGRLNLADATGFDSTWIELGAAVEASLREALSAGAQTRVRVFLLEDSQAGDAFDDLSSSGSTGFQELSGELRFRPGHRRVLASAGVWARIYDHHSPYIEISGDARLGGRAAGEWWLDRRACLRGIAEAAQPSQAFAPELGTQFSLRLVAEVAF